MCLKRLNYDRKELEKRREESQHEIKGKLVGLGPQKGAGAAWPAGPASGQWRAGILSSEKVPVGGEGAVLTWDRAADWGSSCGTW